MTTDLQRQLHQLKGKQLHSDPLHAGKPSLFLSPKEAAAIDTKEVYEAALQGMLSLQQYDSRFGDYLESLLHQSSVNMQRILKTKDENDLLNKQINDLLSLLALFVNEKSTHMILEYLLRRYLAHELNVESLILCVIPMHDTKLFAKVVSLCSIQNTCWSFLEGVQKTGSPLPRNLLILQCRKDASLLQRLREGTMAAMNLASGKPSLHSSNGADRIISFFTGVAMGLAEEKGLSDKLMRILYPYLIGGLELLTTETLESVRHSVQDMWRKSSSLMLLQIAQTTAFGEKLLEKVTLTIAHAFNTVVATNSDREYFCDVSFELIYIIAVLADHQDLRFSGETLSLLLGDVVSPGPGELTETLLAMKAQFDISRLILSLVGCILMESSELSTSTKESSWRSNLLESEWRGYQAKCSQFLRSLIVQRIVTAKEIPSLLSKTFELCAGGLVQVEGTVVAELVQLIAERFPQDFDAIAERKQLPAAMLQQILQCAHLNKPYLVTKSSRIEMNTTSLLLKLQNSSSQIRASAVKEFSCTVPLNAEKSNDITELCRAASFLLADTDASVALAAWTFETISRLQFYLEGTVLAGLISNALTNWEPSVGFPSKKQAKVLTAIFEVLPAIKDAVEPEFVSWLWVKCIFACSRYSGLVNQPDVSEDDNKTASRSGQRLQILRSSAWKACQILSGVTQTEELPQGMECSDAVIDFANQGLCSNNKSIENMWCIRLNKLLDQSVSLLDAQSNSIDEVAVLAACRLGSSCFLTQSAKERVLPSLLQATIRLIGHLGTSSNEIVINGISDVVSRLLEALTIDEQPFLDCNSLEDFGNMLTATFDPKSAPWTLLTILLASRNAVLFGRVGKLLNLMCESYPILPILQLVSSQHTAPDVLLGSLRCLATWIGAVNSDVASSPQVMIAVLTSLVVCVVQCSSESPTVRKAAIKLAKKLSILKSLEKQTIYSASASGESLGSVEVQCLSIGSIAESISAQASSILLDSASAVARLSTVLFPTNPTEENTLLLWISSSLGLPSIIDSIMRLANGSPLRITWAYVRHVISKAVPLVTRNTIQCLNMIESADLSLQSTIVSTICEWLDHGTEAGTIDELLAIVNESWTEKLREQALRQRLFTSILRFHLNQPGRRSLEAIHTFDLDLTSIISVFSDEIKEFPSDMRDIEGEIAPESVALRIQRLCSFGEAVQGSFRRLGDAKTRSEEQLIEVQQLVGCLLDLTDVIEQPSARIAYGFEYLQTWLFESICCCISCAPVEWTKNEIDSSIKASKKKGKVTAQHSGENLSLRMDRLLDNALSALASAKTLTLQSSILSTVKALLRLVPNARERCVSALGKCLTGATDTNKSFAQEIIKTLGSLVSPLNGLGALPQDIFQPLFGHIAEISVSSRTALLSLALEITGDCGLPSCIITLLSNLSRGFDSSAATDSKSLASNGYILLSMSAQRKAKHLMKTSLPEELFRQGIATSLRFSPVVQLRSVITLIMCSHSLLENATFSDAVEIFESADPIVISHMDDLPSFQVDVMKTVNYMRQFLSVPTGNGKGEASVLGLLSLEFVLELLREPALHEQLVNFLETEEDDANDVAVCPPVQQFQLLLLEMADHLLQLYALCSRMHNELGNNSKQSIPMQLNDLGAKFDVPLGPFARNVADVCLEVLQAMQQLLDAPTFVAIFQELLGHENAAVRQKALQMLGKRIENLGPSMMRGEEGKLFLELVSHLKAVIQDVRSLFPSCPEEIMLRVQNENIGEHQTIGLAQSAMVCLDVLASNVAADKRPESRDLWHPLLIDLLSETTKLNGTVITGCSQSQQTHELELIKLLGSSFLLSGTLCKVVGGKAVPVLKGIMEGIISSLDAQRELLLKSGAGDISSSDVRSRMLLVRSTLVAASTVSVAMPSYVHVYLGRLLLSALLLSGLSARLPGVNVLVTESHRCLTSIIRNIPPRLAIPELLQAAPSILLKGPDCAIRFAELLSDVWEILDRPTLLAHLGDVSTMIVMTFDYRRAAGEYSDVVNHVEDKLIESAVSLCLKFTETELRNLLLRLAEWRDVKLESIPQVQEMDSSSTKKKRSRTEETDSSHVPSGLSRSVCYYHLIAALCAKLQGIFAATMSTIWTSCVDALTGFPGHVDTTAAGDNKGSGSKKKKILVSSENARPTPTQDTEEAVLRSKYILDSVRTCCIHAATGFVDEMRYEAMMPAVAALLLQRAAFHSDEAYSGFCDEFLFPCLTALATAVGKDLLWKPLNRKVLSAMRDKKRVVRVVSLRLLQRLFAEIGEEYLLLLPECLPYISEAMEDDSEEVSNVACEVVRYIEELSGEKLDSYLQ